MIEPNPPKPAASVVPLRPGKDGSYEVFLVQRSLKGSFFPGFHAFPGGAQEKSDELPGPWPGVLVCAVRELFEESGLWPGPHNPGPERRRELLAGRLEMADLLADLPPGLADFIPAGLRTTPDYSPIRFAAQFYLWEVHPAGGEAEIWPGELESGAWWSVPVALQAWRDNQIALAAPTQSVLLALAGAGGLSEAARVLIDHGPHTPDPIPVTPGWAYVALETPTLPPARHTLCYLIGQEECLIVDPGSRETAQCQRLEAVLSGRRPQAVIFTHDHPDHVGGWEWAKQKGLPIWCHALTAQRLPQIPVVRRLVDGETLICGGVELTVLHTPGHACGHIALWEARRKILLAADLVSSISTIVVAPPEGNMAEYFASLRRCRDLHPALVLPSHGAPLGPGSDILGRTLEHRQTREDKVARALQPQPQDLDLLLERVYDDTPRLLWPIARASLLAHLQKLQSEGLADVNQGAWVKLPS